MALKLNERALIEKVFTSIPSEHIPLIARDIHPTYLQRYSFVFQRCFFSSLTLTAIVFLITFKIRMFRLLDFIVISSNNSPHVEFHLLWIQHLFNVHGRHLKEHASKYMSTFRALQKFLVNSHRELASLYVS
jgi:periodic tryptophan protein 2